MKLMNPFGFTEKIYVQFCNKTAVSGAQLFRDEKVDTYSPCDLSRSANSERSVHLPDMYSERPCPHGPVLRECDELDRDEGCVMASQV